MATSLCLTVVGTLAPASYRPLEVDASAADGTLVVVVRDGGRGMGSFTGEGGLGLGLPLITALTRSVEMRANGAGDGGGGTEVVMVFATRSDDGI